MRLSWIEVTDYRSYEALRFEPDPGVNVLVGDNGSGKTSLLEAVGYLASLASFRRSPDASLVRIGSTGAVIRGEFSQQAPGSRLQAPAGEEAPGSRLQAPAGEQASGIRASGSSRRKRKNRGTRGRAGRRLSRSSCRRGDDVAFFSTASVPRVGRQWRRRWRWSRSSLTISTW